MAFERALLSFYPNPGAQLMQCQRRPDDPASQRTLLMRLIQFIILI